MLRAAALGLTAVALVVATTGCGGGPSSANAARHAAGRLSFTFVKGMTVSPTSPDVAVLMNAAAASFRVLRKPGEAPKVSVAGDVADVNGDGKPDLATYVNTSDDPDSCSEDSGVSVCPAYGYVLPNRGDDTYAHPKQIYDTDTADIAALAAGDLNGDAKPDLAFAYSDFVAAVDGVEVLPNHGSARFDKHGKFRATAQPPVAVLVADVNGDGKSDVVTANSEDAESNKLGAGSISVLLGRGDGSFEPRRDYLVGGGADGLVAGDVDGDGKPDLVVARGEAGPFVSVLLNRGGGTFAPKRDYRAAARSAAGVAIGDLNVDGRPDLATWNYGHGVSVLLNRGRGVFGPREDFADGKIGGIVAIGDLDGDGRLDILISSLDVGGPAALLVNDG